MAAPPIRVAELIIVALVVWLAILQRSIAENAMSPEGDFSAHYFDSRAVSRVLHMSFRDSTWKWWRHATGADDFDQRFEGTLSGDGSTIESACYLLEDGEWTHDFDVTCTRAQDRFRSSACRPGR